MNDRGARRRRSVSPYRVFGGVGVVVGLVLTAFCVVILDLPLYPAWVIGLSVCAFALYGLDKRRAITGGGRVPEAVLHGLALAGGFPGGWAGRAAFRHKTRHVSFVMVLVLATVIHGVLGYWLLR